MWRVGAVVSPDFELQDYTAISGNTSFEAALAFYLTEQLVRGEMVELIEPVEIQESLERLRGNHPDPTKAAFIMMRFGKTKAHGAIVEAITNALSVHGIAALRADSKEYHSDTWWNIVTYMHGCGFGIAVFERLEQEEFNPNVSLEVGYMLALGKEVCLLKDRTMRAMPSDLMGKLYRVFEPQDPVATIPSALHRWLEDRELVGPRKSGARRRRSHPPPPISRSQRVRTEQDDHELIQDGVLWRDEGENYFDTGNAMADGPLCPDDKATLLYAERGYDPAEVREVRNEDYVSSFSGLLHCPECGRSFDLGGQNATVREVRRKAEARFQGKRRQGRSTS